MTKNIDLTSVYVNLAQDCLDRIPTPQSEDDYRKAYEALRDVMAGREVNQLLPLYMVRQIYDIQHLLADPSLYIITESDTALFATVIKAQIAKKADQLSQAISPDNKHAEQSAASVTEEGDPSRPAYRPC